MPELPEVETMRTDLASKLVGAKLSEVQLHRADLRRPFPKDFGERLDVAVVRDVGRRAKYLLIYLDSGEVWVTHLGMTGLFAVHRREDRPPGERPKHLHFQCRARRGSVDMSLDFHDKRRFGYMLLLPDVELEVQAWYKELGVEPLSQAFDTECLLDLARDRKVPLKALLMDQAAVAGLGNIYSCEALWAARLRPDRPANTLSRHEAVSLVAGVKAVIHDAVRAGVASLETDGPRGRDGYFEYHYSAYNRAGSSCRRDDGGIIVKASERGRSSFYCPVCQK